MKSLMIFAQKHSNDDLGLTLNFFMARSNVLTFWAFIWEDFLDFVDDFSANVNKYSSKGEQNNRFFFCSGS